MSLSNKQELQEYYFKLPWYKKLLAPWWLGYNLNKKNVTDNEIYKAYLYTQKSVFWNFYTWMFPEIVSFASSQAMRDYLSPAKLTKGSYGVRSTLINSDLGDRLQNRSLSPIMEELGDEEVDLDVTHAANTGLINSTLGQPITVTQPNTDTEVLFLSFSQVFIEKHKDKHPTSYWIDFQTSITLLAKSDFTKSFQLFVDKTDIIYTYLSLLEGSYNDAQKVVKLKSPTVMLRALMELFRLGILKEITDLAYLKTQFLYDDKAQKHIFLHNLPEIFSIWFGNKELINLWERLGPQTFNRQQYFYLFRACHNILEKNSDDGLNKIRLFLRDNLQIVLFSPKVMELDSSDSRARYFARLPQKTNSLSISNITLNIDKLIELFFQLPQDIVYFNVYSKDLAYKVDNIIAHQIILTSFEINHIDDCDKLQFSFAINESRLSKLTSVLERYNNPLANLACGLLLLGKIGNTLNPSDGQNLPAYLEKRSHAAIDFLEKVLHDSSSRVSIIYSSCSNLTLLLEQSFRLDLLGASCDRVVNLANELLLVLRENSEFKSVKRRLTKAQSIPDELVYGARNKLSFYASNGPILIKRSDDIQERDELTFG